jgi:hypothetical protein
MQAEQLARRPAERLSLLAPSGQEGLAILDCLPPTVGLDHVGAAGFQGGDCATIFVHCSGGNRLAKSDQDWSVSRRGRA